MCNLDSVARAVEECGGKPVITDQAKEIELANHIILPGVGAFREAMRSIRQRSLDEILREHAIDQNIPLLGICLGMQLLATKGWEVEETEGLGWICGEVKRIEPFENDTRIPHIGWNEVQFVRESPLFKGMVSGRDFYFVHSYHLCPQDEEEVLTWTPYGKGFVSAVQRGMIYGVQFHPEKSQRLGFQVLKNFLAI
jgi:imidazole glycerol-phosphate synthase subunit HisH